VNCEIISGGDLRVGDSVAIVPNSHQPKRVNPGHKPPAFFVKPADRTLEQAKGMVIPPFVAFVMAAIDPEGFERLEAGYRSAGQNFWSPQAYSAGKLMIRIRMPLGLVALAATAAATLAVGKRLVR